MPRKHLPHVVAEIEALLRDPTVSCNAIAQRLSISKRSVEQMKQNQGLYGQSYSPVSMIRGRPRALTVAEEDWMLAFLDDDPGAYLDEVALALWDEFGVDVSIKTISKTLQRRRWSRKTMKQRARQFSEQLRAIWTVKSSQWSAEQLVFVDESASHDRTGYRKRGWSPIGVSCTELKTLGSGERYSVLPALTIDGYLPNPLVIQGGVNKDNFLWWLDNNVLPELTPGFHILIMDNCKTHHGIEVVRLCEKYGVQLEYLPPYSPDFNPIELTFNTLKGWVKRHISEVSNFENFPAFMIHGMDKALGGSSARAYFKKCGYDV